ncbi:hypothetical protein ACTXT7_003945 [Hymenolepis weldensis]
MHVCKVRAPGSKPEDSSTALVNFKEAGTYAVDEANSLANFVQDQALYKHKKAIILNPVQKIVTYASLAIELRCEHIPGRQFRSGSYKCMCRQGFEYPFNDLTWFFDGETMEKEYDLMIHGQQSRYDLLKCRQSLAISLQFSVGLMIASVMRLVTRLGTQQQETIIRKAISLSESNSSDTEIRHRPIDIH